jgi:hypothetical protein
MPVTPPTPADVRIFPSRQAFRDWLEEQHDRADALFVGYYKKGVPKVAMTYPGRWRRRCASAGSTASPTGWMPS